MTTLRTFEVFRQRVRSFQFPPHYCTWITPHCCPVENRTESTPQSPSLRSSSRAQSFGISSATKRYTVSLCRRWSSGRCRIMDVLQSSKCRGPPRIHRERWRRRLTTSIAALQSRRNHAFGRCRGQVRRVAEAANLPSDRWPPKARASKQAMHSPAAMHLRPHAGLSRAEIVEIIAQAGQFDLLASGDYRHWRVAGSHSHEPASPAMTGSANAMTDCSTVAKSRGAESSGSLCLSAHARQRG
jgi:hypothetical protein